MDAQQKLAELQALPSEISVAQMMEFCGIKDSTAYKLRREKIVRYEKRGHFLFINRDDCIKYLIEQEFLYPADSSYIIALRDYYTEKLMDSPDVLDSYQIQEILGYARSAIIRWLDQGKIENFKCGRKMNYRIPKACLLDFLCSRYFNTIRLKSAKHNQYMSEFNLRQEDV